MNIIQIPDKLKKQIQWEYNLQTEFMTFNYIKNNNIKLPLPYIAFPWAFLIDTFNCKYKNKCKTFYDFMFRLGLIDILNKYKNCITTVQSYHLNSLLEDFQKMNIKFIFYTHTTFKIMNQSLQKYNIKLIPYHIYPSNTKYTLNDKNYKCSFIGTVNYNLDKPTKIRNEMVKCCKNIPNSFIETINEWHYNDLIFGDQLKVLNFKKSYKNDMKERENKYSNIMSKSIFSLCPLGIGPNSIRLWESFFYDSIPILISDDLMLPNEIKPNTIIRVNENDMSNIKSIITNEKIDKKIYLQNIKNFKNEFLIDNNFGKLVNNYFNKDKTINLLIPWFNLEEGERYDEIVTCLFKNIKNKLINKIYLFYEVSDINLIKSINHNKIIIIPIITDKKRDVSFNKLVDYANKNLNNELCIISNNDIYFDQTLKNIFDLDFYNNDYFVSLTRKNCDEYIAYNNKIWKPHQFSQDSWIFKSPIKQMEHTINLGWIQCDNIISDQYKKLKYQVINPHYSINAWHLHKNNNTKNLLENYNYNNQFKMASVELTNISNILDQQKIEVNINNKYKSFNIDRLKNIKLNSNNG